MWTTRSEELVGVGGLRYAVDLDARPATTVDVLRGWQQDAGFRALFNALLAGAPFTAFRWETPAVTTATLERPFEFVVLDWPELARRSDPEAFAEHFVRAEASVVVFPNLGGDAILVAPCPAGDELAYGHVAAFVRLAPKQQQGALWQSVGAAMARRVSSKPVWLSTAGDGVAWLHVRLDDRPKYYAFGPYRATP